MVPTALRGVAMNHPVPLALTCHAGGRTIEEVGVPA
jgi:hypothetical protein